MEPTPAVLVDLSRFTAAGYGNLYGAELLGLQPEQLIAVRDVGSDILVAEVLEVHDDHARVRVRWDQVLHRDQVTASPPAAPA
jgi:hypothetical protein